MRFQHVAMVIIALASAVCASQGDETLPGGEVKTLTVAVVSSHSEFCDVEANLKHLESLIKEAKGRGARLVCFPELALMAYSTEKEILAVAEEIPGPSTARLEAIARSHDVYLPLGQVVDRTTQQDGEEKMIVVTLKRPLAALVPPYELRHLHRR